MTVKGMLVDSGMAPTNPYFSIDSGRIAFQGGSPTGVVIYDINSSSSISFANPPQPACLFPSISGDKVVVACSNGYQAPQTLYYCILPHSFPMQACGPWTAVLTGLPSIGQHPYPAISGDLVAYSLNNAFGYYRFSTGTNITIRTDYQPHYVTSNGEIIAFTGGSPDTLRYYDTSAPLGQRAIVNTTLSGEYPSISQSTISFSDTTTTPERIRYYDILRNQSSRAGIGPVGIPTPGYAGTSIWDNRIVFKIDEVSAGFDCNGDGTMSSTESCLGYWNIHSPSWVATTLAYSAAPAVN